MSDNKSRELRQFWAAVKHAQRLSDKIRARMNEGKLSADDEEAIAVVPIKESALVSKRHLIRRTAR
jgi:hypothetical protein